MNVFFERAFEHVFFLGGESNFGLVLSLGGWHRNEAKGQELHVPLVKGQPRGRESRVTQRQNTRKKLVQRPNSKQNSTISKENQNW